MAGEFLHGTTTNMHHLASQTGANAEQMSATTANLNSQLLGGLAPNWLGSGAGAFFTTQDTWTIGMRNRVLETLANLSTNIRTAANLYDITDLDAHGVQSSGGGLGGVINPPTA